MFEGSPVDHPQNPQAFLIIHCLLGFLMLGSATFSRSVPVMGLEDLHGGGLRTWRGGQFFLSKTPA